MQKTLQILLFINLVFIGFAFAQTDIKKVDFKNFTFQPTCGNSQTRSLTVTNGSFFEEKLIPQVPKKKQKTTPAPVYERKYFSPYEMIYGDLNGDGIDEAIVLTSCSNGGIESYSEGFVYGIKDDNPELLARIEGGDRALGGLRSVKIENGIISVERSRPGLDGNACCAETAETMQYRLLDGSLSQVGEKTIVKIYPPVRILFPGETRQTSLNIELPKRDEFKRFVVTGQKGQLITVSTNSNDARLRLFKGNVKLILDPKPVKKTDDYKATNRLVAVFNETGDMVFEVGNLSDQNMDLNIAVTVEIK
jgi:hypothetical protein